MTDKITSLSPEQEAALDEVAEKWLHIGLSTEPVDAHDAASHIDALYDAFGLTRPEQIILEASPRAVAALLEEIEGDDAVDRKAGYVGGGLWAGYYGWLDYMTRILGVDDDGIGRLAVAVAERVSYWWPFERVAILSDRPCEIHTTPAGSYDGHEGIWKSREVTHRDGGPAIRWSDGDAIWCLNGVEVPQWLAETKTEDLDAARIKELDNVEVRREFIRKVGIERVYQSLGGKVLDSATFENDTGVHRYELVSLHTYGEDRDPRPYLKMENPSLRGTYHLERVPLGTTTVRAALCFRNSLEESQIDDANGADWVQQGDVILRPDGAETFKFFPKVLT